MTYSDTAALVETAAQLAYERRIEWRMGAETARTAWVELDEFGKERERTCQRAALAVALSALAETQARLAEADAAINWLRENPYRPEQIITRWCDEAIARHLAREPAPPAAAAERGETT